MRRMQDMHLGALATRGVAIGRRAIELSLSFVVQADDVS
jgi:hypothetical protein